MIKCIFWQSSFWLWKNERQWAGFPERRCFPYLGHHAWRCDWSMACTGCDQDWAGDSNGDYSKQIQVIEYYIFIPWAGIGYEMIDRKSQTNYFHVSSFKFIFMNYFKEWFFKRLTIKYYAKIPLVKNTLGVKTLKTDDVSMLNYFCHYKWSCKCNDKIKLARKTMRNHKAFK